MWRFGIWVGLLLLGFQTAGQAASTDTNVVLFPPVLSEYRDAELGFWQKLGHRARSQPLNVAATVIFALAIIHTFLAPRIMHHAHKLRDEHKTMLEERRRAGLQTTGVEDIEEVSFKAEVFHFLGEIEAVFGIWVLPLVAAFVVLKDWSAAEHYLSQTVQYTEPMFVVVVMTIAATRPVLKAAEAMMTWVAKLGGGGAAASWLAILTLGPMLGSFITEPAAMTICALLLSRKFYDAKPRRQFAYATLGLLFVNVSIGGTLTHFAAPPVLMVAGRWGWGIEHMATNFGWKAMVSIMISNLIYFLWFRRDFAALKPTAAKEKGDPVPPWITIVHLLFLGWTVFAAHHPALFIGAFLFFLAFALATEHHQSPIALRPAMLVGFFLAGLVIHGGLQGWWIAPVLSSVGETALFFAAASLTAVNDNAAITFLATLVPDLSDGMKYAVVAGAVTGGGLTVIANAPNPAGQSILSKHFPDGVSPLNLFLGALIPTGVAALCYLVFR